MKKSVLTVLFFVIFLGLHFLSRAQFTPEEIAERAKWEEFLKSAEIVEERQIGRGVETAPWGLSLEKNGMKRGAIWKNPKGTVAGHEESWKWEIAAYRLDKYLGLNMVPPTVEREFQGKRGSCQLWVTAEMDLRKKTREKIETPTDKVYSWNNGIYLTRAFDNLIANEDRHQGSILVTKDWRLILIDHSRSFGTSEQLTTELIFSGEKDDSKIMRRLPRVFVDKLKSMNSEVVKEIVGDYLTDKEIAAVLMRRDLILKEIARLIEKHGEADVLY
jgi:hypothetical protein